MGREEEDEEIEEVILNNLKKKELGKSQISILQRFTSTSIKQEQTNYSKSQGKVKSQILKTQKGYLHPSSTNNPISPA